MAAVDGVRASGGQSSDPAVAHALQVITAVNKDNYHAFFNLYPVTPNNGVYLMDFFLHDMRKRRYQRLLTAYAPTLPLEMMLVRIVPSYCWRVCYFLSCNAVSDVRLRLE